MEVDAPIEGELFGFDDAEVLEAVSQQGSGGLHKSRARFGRSVEQHSGPPVARRCSITLNTTWALVVLLLASRQATRPGPVSRVTRAVAVPATAARDAAWPVRHCGPARTLSTTPSLSQPSAVSATLADRMKAWQTWPSADHAVVPSAWKCATCRERDSLL
ncbi:hypothetical protein [Streptomyces sp. NBC_00687]|uniref:hypothetical protein n=1 Tax=Streptomyces sp. NBC_00687 TaxID=2975807 RepID=UPI00225A9C54|nr:hypothetical protein [Streptomyces sp. NBC_00687]MCX4918884.1 hypothetical protein [Streptomyces sp. NBC_00687]